MPTELKPRKTPEKHTLDVDNCTLVGYSVLLPKLSWSVLGGLRPKLVQCNIVHDWLYWLYILSVIVMAVMVGCYAQLVLFGYDPTGISQVACICVAYILSKALGDKINHNPISERSVRAVLKTTPDIVVVDPTLDETDD